MNNKLDHIALILDGNKRWARNNNFSSIYGYSKGFENIRTVIKHSLSLKLNNLTIFALSSENFQRSSVNIIYDIIYDNFSKYLDELIRDHGVKIQIFGSRSNLPKRIIEIFNNIENLSSKNKDLNLNIAFNYGFKNEVKNILKNLIHNNININFDKDDELNKLFFLNNVSDPDLLIRTGGYQRLSNFLLWQLAYSELFFLKKLWPDFNSNDLLRIIKKYKNIKRNYGNI